MFKFTIRDLLWLTVVARGWGGGWIQKLSQLPIRVGKLFRLAAGIVNPESAAGTCPGIEKPNCITYRWATRCL
jgi:hypothetical protein